MLMFNKYNSFYKSCLLDYGLFYADIVNSNFIYCKDLSNYIYKSLIVLKAEYDNNLMLYKESKDIDLFKINIYLLGLELEGFLSYLCSFNIVNFDNLNKFYLLKLKNLVSDLIHRIRKKMCKWKSDIKL